MYTRASRGVCRLPQRKVTPSEKNETPSEKDKTISEVISSTSEKNKTTSEENVARSLGGEEGGYFLSSGACSAFWCCAGLLPESVKSVLKSGTSGAFGRRDVYISVGSGIINSYLHWNLYNSWDIKFALEHLHRNTLWYYLHFLFIPILYYVN